LGLIYQQRKGKNQMYLTGAAEEGEGVEEIETDNGLECGSCGKIRNDESKPVNDDDNARHGGRSIEVYADSYALAHSWRYRACAWRGKFAYQPTCLN
jgi:hypothetical protein